MHRRTACSLIALGVVDAVLGEDVPWEAPTRSGLAALEQGRRNEAEENFGIALSIAKRANADDLVIAGCLDNLALAARLDFGQRDAFYRQSLAIRERRLGPDDPEVARSLANVASTAYKPSHRPGDLKEAQQMLDRALKIAEAQPKSEVMAEVLETMGLFRHYGCALRNSYAELPETVEPLYQRALEIREANPGQDDIALARILELKTVLLRETGRDDQAKSLIVRASDIRKQHFQKLSPGVSHPGHPLGGAVTPPSILSKTEPQYTDLARMLKWQGTVVVALVVTETGAVDSIRLRRSLGLGLDEEALFGVRKWKFQPGETLGERVVMIATIEVNFRLL